MTNPQPPATDRLRDDEVSAYAALEERVRAGATVSCAPLRLCISLASTLCAPLPPPAGLAGGRAAGKGDDASGWAAGDVATGLAVAAGSATGA